MTIELEGGTQIPILYEDRSVLALDKPAGWMLAPDSWDQTARNLQLALISSMNGGDFWARSRNLKFLRFVHRLDAETTGITLFAKSPGALTAFTELFEARRVEKRYLAVVRGVPTQLSWHCTFALAPDPKQKGRMLAMRKPSPQYKEAETRFRVVQSKKTTALVEAQPLTGRTHQIRVHLAATGYPVFGDALYGTDKPAASRGRQRLALRAIGLAFRDPFDRRPIRIEAPTAEFLEQHGFDPKPAETPVPS